MAILRTKAIYELIPPNRHRQNDTKKAIRILKNHFLSDLATCGPDCPIHEWDRLLSQYELALNLLRTSQINPKLSSWAILNVLHNLNKVPLAPPGTTVLVHNKLTQHNQ